MLEKGDAQRADYVYFSAAASYRQAALLDPRDPEPLLRLGDVYLDLEQYVDAMQAYAAASRISGNTPEIYAGLARASEGHGDFAAAAEQWREVIARQPADTQAQINLARVLVAQEAWDEARAVLAKLLEKQINFQAHFMLGQLAMSDEPDAAQAHFQAAAQEPALVIDATECLRILSGSDDAAYRAAQAGRWWLARGELHLARRAFARAVELNPAFAEARAYLGHVLDQLGRDGGAQLAQAADAAPDAVMVRYLWGLHLRQVGDLAGARTSFETALARDPSNAALAAEIGLTAVQNREYVEGETWLIKAAELDPGNPAWAMQLAQFYTGYLIAVADKGLPSAKEAVRLAPDDAKAHSLLGWAYYLTGDLATAQAELEEALALNPRYAAAHYYLAAVLSARGQPDAARLETERAASLDPGGEMGRRARQMLGE